MLIPAEQSSFHQYYGGISPHALAEQVLNHVEETLRVLRAVPEDKAGFAYAPGKWTVRQLTGHILISHRIFVTRALCMARGEEKPFPGYDEEAYAQGWPPEKAALGEIVSAYGDESRATLNWLRWMTPSELEREGVANGIRLRPQQLFRALIGHERHHLGVLRERYGLPFSRNGKKP